MGKLKFDYGKILTVNGNSYIKYKNYWWNIAIVMTYEDVPGNDSAADVLEDIDMDTAFENNVQLSVYGDTYLVNYIYIEN